MQGDDRNASDAFYVGIWPRAGREIRHGSDVQMITKCDLGRFPYYSRFVGDGQDHFVDELGAGEPVQVFNST